MKYQFTRALLISRVSATLFAGLFIPFPAAPALAQKLEVESMVMLSGKCERNTVIFDKELTGGCSKLMNVVHKNGRSGFHVIVNDWIISLSGLGYKQIQPNSADKIQPIDLLILNKVGRDPKRPGQFKAVGDCTHQNPFIGMPARIECKGNTEEGSFLVVFNHDGSDPVVLVKDGVRQK
jgi:hypothetical protein